MGTVVTTTISDDGSGRARAAPKRSWGTKRKGRKAFGTKKTARKSSGRKRKAPSKAAQKWNS